MTPLIRQLTAAAFPFLIARSDRLGAQTAPDSALRDSASVIAEFPTPPTTRWRKRELKMTYDKYTDSSVVFTRVTYWAGVTTKNMGFTVIDLPEIHFIPYVRFQGQVPHEIPKYVTIIFRIVEKQGYKQAIRETARAPLRINIPMIVDGSRKSLEARLLDKDLDFAGSTGRSELTYAVEMSLGEFLTLTGASVIEGRIGDAEFKLEKDYVAALRDILSAFRPAL